MIPEKHEAARDSDFRRPHNQRKSSFSDAINKLTATTFNRRRTTNVLPPSKSSTQFLHKSRLPTPSGVPRSSSFLSSLNKFTSRSSEHCTYPNENNPPLPPGKRSQNLSDRLAQTAFVHQRSTHSHIPATPVTPGNKRESSVKIEQRGLMQPMPPPLPRSSTMGDLLTPQTTSSAFDLASSVSRPASGSAERKGRLAMNKRENALSPPMRVVRLQNPPGGFPRRKDSLMPPPPARALATVQDVGCEASAAHDSSLDSEGIEEDTVLCVPRKEGQRTHHHESMIRKQKSSFREEFDTEHPRQGKKFDAEDAPLNERGRQTMQGESEETLTDPDDINDPCLVHSAKPLTYWLGRYTALSDTARCLALATPPPSSLSTTTSSSSTLASCDHNHPMHDAARRDKAVFSQLRELCTTEEARESLAAFAGLMMEAMMEAGRRDGEAEGRKRRGKNFSGGVREKKGWLEGLMGKRRVSGEKG